VSRKYERLWPSHKAKARARRPVIVTEPRQSTPGELAHRLVARGLAPPTIIGPNAGPATTRKRENQ
jgi:hypothetical protein